MNKIIAILSAAALLLPAVSQAQEKPDGDGRTWAVVEFSSNYLRRSPDYESGLDTQTLMGAVVEVLDSERYWRKVSTPDPYVGWVNERGLAYMSEEEKDAYIEAPKWICTAEITHIFEEPDASSARICDFIMGDLVRKTGEYRPGWTLVKLPSGITGWVRSYEIADFYQWASTRVLSEESVVALAKTFLGTPYLWGGDTVKGFDCSGLVKMTYMMHGVLTMRDADQQMRTGVEVPYDFAQMRPGDLLFFGTKATATAPAKAGHVAIYIGDGKIIHASQNVHVRSLVKGEPDYYEREVIAVRRLIGHVDTGEGVVSILKNPWYFKQ